MSSPATSPAALYPTLAPATRLGGPEGGPSRGAVRRFVAEHLDGVDLDGRSMVVVVPDGTRSCPLPLLLGAVHEAVAGRVSRLTVAVALGTHAPMTDDALARHLGAHDRGGLAAAYPGATVVQHEWQSPETFVDVGTVPASRLGELSGGLLERDVSVRVNRVLVEHDVTLVLGPVFPHEVVGFSGGNKYLFPGLADREVIDISHWLGALIGSARIIGTRGITPVRGLIDAAADLVPGERQALCVVVAPGTGHVVSVSAGSPERAWEDAAEVSAQTHIRYLDRPVGRVLSLLPDRYADLWTGAKGFYKVEPVVADGGEVVLLAPHISEVAATHPLLRDIGYHCRDYFLRDWSRFQHLPWGDLAHSTHLRGVGTVDDDGTERCRVDVALATAIPRDVVEQVALRWVDPASVDVQAWHDDPDALVVRDAGEVLYRLRESDQAH